MVFDVSIYKVTEQLIHCGVHHKGTNRKLSVIMVYGFNDAALRRKLWQDIKDNLEHMSEPWAVMGDFNCILNKGERIGSPITMSEIRDFKQCVEECTL